MCNTAGCRRKKIQRLQKKQRKLSKKLNKSGAVKQFFENLKG